MIDLTLNEVSNMTINLSEMKYLDLNFDYIVFDKSPEVLEGQTMNQTNSQGDNGTNLTDQGSNNTNQTHSPS